MKRLRRIAKVSGSRGKFLILGVVLTTLWGAFLLTSQMVLSEPSPSNTDYAVIGWNDLGMHCINPSFSELALLPPFNNLWVQVIQRGDPPKIVTSGFSLDYSLVNNTTVQGKTDFWSNGSNGIQLAQQLFNLSKPLPLGIGLTGNGLSGRMQLVGDHFEATGIPVLPYDDQMNWNPFQIATVTLRNNPGKGNKTGQTIRVVLPVSDEINCAMCHMMGGDGTVSINGGVDSVNMNILMTHDYYHGSNGVSSTGPNLVDMKPVLCATCHSSNALGAKGLPGVKSVSLAMHGWHNGVDRAPDATCYSCHPGELTQCLRTGIGGMGYLGTEPSCQTGMCHGGISGMGNPNRNCWVTEPNCERCHGSNYSTGGNLYRHARGHGGVYCAGCHNSPHAWWPSKLWADNLQPMKLQRSSNAIGNCGVCHTKKQAGDNPHVTYLSSTPK